MVYISQNFCGQLAIIMMCCIIIVSCASGSIDEYSKTDDIQDKIDRAADEMEAGIVAARANKLDQAEVHFFNSLELGMSKSLSYKMLGMLRLNQRRFDESIKFFEDSLEYEQDSEVYYYQASALMEKGEYRKAIENYKICITMDPEFAHAYSSMGRAYDLLGNGKDAVKHLTKAIRLNPGVARFYLDRAYALYSIGNEEDALNDFKMAVTLDENYATAFGAMAETYFRMGKDIQGCKNAEKACDLGACFSLERYGESRCARLH